MKSEKYAPKVGEKLWLVHSDYRTREHDREVEVIKVGRKYFYIKLYSQEIKFDLKTWQHMNEPYCSSYVLYTSKSEHERRIEINQKYKHILKTIHLLDDDEIDQIYEWLIRKDEILE